MATRVYLDTNVYNRPFDDQSQPRIWLETLAFSVILQLIEDDELDLVTSTVLSYENSRNPDPERQQWVQRVLTLAKNEQQLNASIRERAVALEGRGVKALDALHVAAAEASASDYFITTDDRLIRHYRALTQEEQLVIVSTPTEVVRDLTGDQK